MSVSPVERAPLSSIAIGASSRTSASSNGALLAASAGLVATLIPVADRDHPRGRERALGIVLSAHQAETFRIEPEGRLLELTLAKARRRFEGGAEPQVRYRFEVVSSRGIPGDPEDHLRFRPPDSPEGRGSDPT